MTSADGALRVSSGTVDGGITRFESRSHPRYDPDRQFGWATASPGFPVGQRGTVRFGCFTTWEGYYLSLNVATGVITAYSRRTTGVVAPAPEDHSSGLGAATIASTSLGTLTLPAGADVSKSTLYDMWCQWRGVGNLRALVNQQAALTTNRLGVASTLWCNNPALPFAIEVERATPGDNFNADFGCIDVSTYDGSGAEHPGGDKFDSYSLTTGSIAGFDNTERPLLTFQAAGFLAGMACTRDHIVRLINDLAIGAAGTVRIRQNATISNAGITWSIPDASRGLVLGLWNATGTVAGGKVVFQRTLSAAGTIDIDEFADDPIMLRPFPGTATTGANRGDPAYGGTFSVTVQKTTGGTMTAECNAQIGSLY